MSEAMAMLSANHTDLVDLNGVSKKLMQNKCPMIFDQSEHCDLAFLSHLLVANESAILATVHHYADRITNSSVSGHRELLEGFARNRSVGDVAFYTLIVLYVHLICFGAVGNGFVVLAVLHKAAMRTARNMFIVNLAVSDLLLCLVTMPLTLMEILTRYWPPGEDTTFLCKLFGGLQGVSVFVSSMSIMAIALDRYQVIVYPTRKSLQLCEVCIIMACIWTVATLFAAPIFFVRRLDHLTLNQSLLAGLPDSFDYCVEAWTVERGRAYYSIFSMVCQYVVPIVIVSIAHARITRKLRFRMSSMVGQTSSTRQARERRARRTHTLLVAIGLIYAVSWVPLNVCNLVSDFMSQKEGRALERMRIMYAVCHMISMSSACSNPILYGWLNDNFRTEFVEITHHVLPCLSRSACESHADEHTPRQLLTNSRTNGCSQLIALQPGEGTQITRDIPMQNV